MYISSTSAPPKRLEGKVAIITGGASGIGEATVRVFLQNGAKVVVADVQDNLGQSLVDELDSKDVHYIHCDVSNEDDVVSLIDGTVNKYGKLDIMYNNAGVMDRSFGSVMDTPKTDIERLLRINTIGGFLGAKHAAKAMVKQQQQKGCCILFTGSACTEIGGLGSPAYAVSKYGILGLVKSLAVELGQYGIRVNCVSPYAVVTGMSSADGVDPAVLEGRLSELGNLKGEVLKPESIAKAALYLASDDASYVNGQNLVVDGGFSSVNPTILKAFNIIK